MKPDAVSANFSASSPRLSSYPRVLTIAGSDSGGGAGIQADLKTFHSCGAYGMSVIAALTAQNTLGVQGILEIEPEFIRKQLDAVLDDIGCDAAKTGMLSAPAAIQEVARAVKTYKVERLVVDPVMVAKSGHRLLRADAIATLVTELLPLALIVTPNAHEAAILAEQPVENVAQMESAARKIQALGPRYVLLKGGHVEEGAPTVADLLVGPNGAAQTFCSHRVDSRHTHGTGCTLSAAIAARLALGDSPENAVERGRAYLEGALRHAKPLGAGIGPVNHLWERESASS